MVEYCEHLGFEPVTVATTVAGLTTTALRLYGQIQAAKSAEEAAKLQIRLAEVQRQIEQQRAVERQRQQKRSDTQAANALKYGGAALAAVAAGLLFS